eukprot:752272-Rhodomonas_salina.1
MPLFDNISVTPYEVPTHRAFARDRWLCLGEKLRRNEHDIDYYGSCYEASIPQFATPEVMQEINESFKPIMQTLFLSRKRLTTVLKQKFVLALKTKALLQENEDELCRASDNLDTILNSGWAREDIELGTTQMAACFKMLYKSRTELLTQLSEQ